MQRFTTAVLAIVLLTIAACGTKTAEPGGPPATPSGAQPTLEPESDVQRQADIYLAVIQGAYPSESKLWIHDQLCADAHEAAPADRCSPMSADLQGALSDRLPTAVFIDDPASIQERYMEGDLAMGDAGGTIWYLGPIDGSGDRVEVPASYWCGGLCASGTTHVVELVDGAWEVTGSVGPVWMS